MKPLSVLVALMIILMSALSVYAGDSFRVNGEVLYHQDFSQESKICESGIKIGTQSSKNSGINCSGDTLEINTYDDGRVYAILPEIVKDDTYTVEFSFRFSEIKAENGFISMILTCRGEEPTNISSVRIRADGTVDNFDPPCENIGEAIRNGETVNVQIPIRSNVLNEIVMTAGEYRCVVERENILVIEDGNMGFAVRNASVQLPEIYVMHGVDYSEKSGYFTDSSYSEDDDDEVILPKPSEDPEEIPETAPDTGDTVISVTAAVLAGIGILTPLNRKKRIL